MTIIYGKDLTKTLTILADLINETDKAKEDVELWDTEVTSESQ